MNDAEAQEYFSWFIGQSENRRKLLLDMIHATGGLVSACDYTPKSLIPLWHSTSQLFEKRAMTGQEREAVFQNAPAAARRVPLDLAELTTSTGCLAMDIGFYVAEIFTRSHPKMHWTICKDEEGPLNEPMIAGFKLYLIPYHLVVSCVWSQLREPKDEWLYEAVRHWDTKNVLPEFQ